MSKNNYWFKRRRYGYGWIPTTWQGITTVVVFILVLLFGLVLLKDVPENTYTKEVGYYLVLVFGAAITLVLLSYLKGPTPKWRWGKKPDDNKEEDF